MGSLPQGVLFGAAYYNEYQPYDRLKTDLDLMKEASFTVIRVGESVWSTWEPENGVFDLDWLQPVLDGASERGISVVLGTPTYAVPPWLVRLYPEVTGERRTGEPIAWGARQEVDFTHPAFLFHAERVIRRILARYVDHPAVIGIQVDNEPGNELFHNRGVFQRFVDYLRRIYGDVETLNREWGLVYWSHRLSTWADLWTPDGNVQPQYDVAWRRFQAAQTTEFIAWQAEIAREYTNPQQFVTTCLAYERPALDDEKLTATLDVTAGNPYYRMQDGLALPDSRTARQYWTTDSTWAMYLTADRMYSSRQEPFLVTETNAMHIGFPWLSEPAYDGQWRQAAWSLVARGARMIEYWHWHTLHFGAETYWGGVLPHNGRPGRTYRELARLGAELAKAGDVVSTLTPDADVTFLFSMPSKWLMQKYPALTTGDGSPDERAYSGFFGPLYRGAFDAGLQARVIHAEQLMGDAENGSQVPPADAVRSHPVLVVPALYVATDAQLQWLAEYAAAGGHLVLGPRTGYGDHEARARVETAPAFLSDAAGIWYDEFSNVAAGIQIEATPDSALTLEPEAAATRWIDGVQNENATVLASYVHPHFGRWPAITTREHGQGRVTYVGTVPNQPLARSIFRWLVPEPGSGWRGLPASVTASTGTREDGTRVHFLHNWSWDEVSLPVDKRLQDLLGEDVLEAGEQLRLGAWDVRVLAEHEG